MALDAIEKHRPDLVVICGDITQFGPGDAARSMLNQIPCTTFAIPGNIDTEDVFEGIANSNATNLHLQKINFKGINFVGINGVNEHDTMKVLNEESCKDLMQDITVLVTHVPPFGFQDKVFLGMHSGNKTLRKIVDIYHPRLVLCGHIHEDPGITEHKGVTIVNCSMGKRGAGAVITVNESISASMIE
jgi:Icc-related predicted phosphoesterase